MVCGLIWRSTLCWRFRSNFAHGLLFLISVTLLGVFRRIFFLSAKSLVCWLAYVDVSTPFTYKTRMFARLKKGGLMWIPLPIP